MSTTPVQVSPAKAHIARLETPYVLTPLRRRRTRPSFSPQKTPHQQPKISHKTSLSLDLDQGEQSSPIPSVATAALEFEEFSFLDSEGNISAKNVTNEQHMALYKLLFDRYNATEFQESFPFLVIGCKGGPPAEDQRPFSIAGAIAIWQDAEEFGFCPIVGESGEGETLKVDDTILMQIHPLEVPSDDIILHFAKLWPDCLAISVLWTFLVVELPRVSPEEFVQHLQTLPSGIEGSIEGCNLSLMFNNGPLPNTERLRKRIVQPDPKDVKKLIADDTDYVTKDGKFYPGTMIGSIDKAGKLDPQATAGILIEKDGERRLTCSFHLWENHYDEFPDKFGKLDAESKEIFKVVQGDDPGSHVGFVRERVGETDIALVELNDGVVFENKFMEIDAAPKKLLHSKDHRLGDKFIFDSFVSGTQTLFCYGRRFTPRWKPGQGHPNLAHPYDAKGNAPEPNVVYISFRQGVFVTSAPKIARKPQIRDSVCGSVLLRCYEEAIGGKRARNATSIMEEGEVGSIMHFSDLQTTLLANGPDIGRYLVYADSFDPLIDDGWTVVQDHDDENEDDDDEQQDSPSKKHKAR